VIFLVVVASSVGWSSPAREFTEKGNLAFKSGKHGEAAQLYSTALALQPDSKVALYNRGLTYYLLKRYDESLQDFASAVRLMPDNDRAYNYSGLIYLKQKRFRQALECFEKASSLSRKPTYVLNAALAAHESGDKEKARVYTEEVLRDDPKNEAALSVARRITKDGSKDPKTGADSTDALASSGAPDEAAEVSYEDRPDGLRADGRAGGAKTDQFLKAISQGNLREARALIDQGVDVNARDDSSGFALFIAASRGNVEALAMLLGARADPNQRAADGRTALMEAVKNKTPGVVSELLKNGASCDIESADGQTALGLAVGECNLDMAAMLLRGGADPNRPYSAILKEAGRDRWHRADRGASSTADSIRTTALIQASAEDCIGIVSLVLDAGADIHASDGKGKTALQRAQESERQQVVKLLRRRGASH
jgi:ankyrin repeat protein